DYIAGRAMDGKQSRVRLDDLVLVGIQLEQVLVVGNDAVLARQQLQVAMTVGEQRAGAFNTTIIDAENFQLHRYAHGEQFSRRAIRAVIQLDHRTGTAGSHQQRQQNDHDTHGNSWNTVCWRGLCVTSVTTQALRLYPPGGDIRRWLVTADGAEPLGATHDHPDIQQQGEQETDQYRNGGAGNKGIQQAHPEGTDPLTEAILQRFPGAAVALTGKHDVDVRCQTAGQQRHQIQNIDHLHQALLVLLLAHHHSPVLVAVTSHCAMQSCSASNGTM